MSMPVARFGRSTRRTGSLVLAAVVAVAGSGTPTPAAVGAAPSAFVIDSLSMGLVHTVRAFHAPGASTINVSWTGTELFITATPPEGNFLQYQLRTGTDQPFSVGTFSTADVNGCAGTVTVHGLEPALQVGVAVEMASISASFGRECGTESTFGELRYHSGDPYSAIGYASVPTSEGLLAMTGAGESFVGRPTDVSAIQLKNLGTTTLTFGPTAFDPAPKAKWTITSNTCNGTLAPGAACTIAGTAVSWIPGGYEDFLTLPVSTVRGHAKIAAPSSFGASRFVPIEPVRLVDTRSGLGVSSSLKSGIARTFTVVDRAPANPAVNIPAEAVAVTGNLIVTQATTAGSAALTTTASNNPSIRTLYLLAGDTRSNAVITRLSESGKLGLTWVGGSGSSAQAIFDATGYFVPTTSPSSLRGGNWRPWPPTRVVNTTTGQGISTRLVAGQPRTFNVPLVGVDRESSAVAGVITVLNPARNGFLYIGSTPVAAPKVSMLHFKAGDTRTNSVVARLSNPADSGTPKKLSVTYVGPAGTSVDLLFDIYGTFGSGNAGYVPLLPSRILDSAAAKGWTKPLVARKQKAFSVANRVPGDPSRNIPPDSSVGSLMFKAGVAGNLWMVQPTATGSVAAVPYGTTMPPNAFAIRARAKDRRASGLILGMSGSEVAFYYAAGTGATSNLILDVNGYFLNP